jgi:hypothetical protein
MIKQQTGSGTPLPVDKGVEWKFIKPDSGFGDNSLLSSGDTEQNDFFPGKIFFQIWNIIFPIIGQKMDRGCVTFVFFKGKNPSHAAYVGGMQADILALEHIRKIIKDRVVTAGDEQRLFCLGLTDC